MSKKLSFLFFSAIAAVMTVVSPGVSFARDNDHRDRGGHHDRDNRGGNWQRHNHGRHHGANNHHRGNNNGWGDRDYDRYARPVVIYRPAPRVVYVQPRPAYHYPGYMVGQRLPRYQAVPHWVHLSPAPRDHYYSVYDDNVVLVSGYDNTIVQIVSLLLGQ